MATTCFWLPEHLELQEIISRFDGITLDAITRQPVRLAYLYGSDASLNLNRKERRERRG